MGRAPSVCALLLAAGEGRRFDPTGRRWKLGASLADGRPLIRASCENLAGVADEVVVVCGDREREATVALAGLPVRIVHCADARSGIGATIRCGVAATAPALGWLIALADMPFVGRSTIASVCDGLRAGATIVRPFLGDSPGHPVGFGVAMRDELLALDAGEGAAALLRRRAADLVRLDVDDPGCVRDVDRPVDLRAAEPPAIDPSPASGRRPDGGRPAC